MRGLWSNRLGTVKFPRTCEVLSMFGRDKYFKFLSVFDVMYN